ncbi:MAG: hypothetical protein HY321_02905 [Armatimonadetes bacterium]|nr:hypothetical protein [Armatimonadota bacterium]
MPQRQAEAAAEILRSLGEARTELEAASAPEGIGTELEAARAPEGRGLEMIAGQAPGAPERHS